MNKREKHLFKVPVSVKPPHPGEVRWTLRLVYAVQIENSSVGALPIHLLSGSLEIAFVFVMRSGTQPILLQVDGHTGRICFRMAACAMPTCTN